MKGIAHFAAGVAVASCFPSAVRAGAEGHPLYFLLGGIFGLLPDTLDFKFSRFFVRHDVEVAPDPNDFDPQLVADALAETARRSGETGRALTVKLDTVRLGSDAWQRYEVTFDVPNGQVAVRRGPVVDTGGRPAPEPAGDPASGRSEAVAPVGCDLVLDYQASTTVDIFDGPSFRMEPVGGGRVRVRFLPWHRAWSHSVVVAGLLGLAATAVWDVWAGAVVFGAWTAHALLDQLGFMGSNLFFPFRSQRTEGFKIMHSGESLPNLFTVWGSCLVIFWNLSRGLGGGGAGVSLPKLLAYGLAAPALLAATLRRRMGRGAGGQ